MGVHANWEFTAVALQHNNTSSGGGTMSISNSAGDGDMTIFVLRLTRSPTPTHAGTSRFCPRQQLTWRALCTVYAHTPLSLLLLHSRLQWRQWRRRHTAFISRGIARRHHPRHGTSTARHVDRILWWTWNKMFLIIVSIHLIGHLSRV